MRASRLFALALTAVSSAAISAAAAEPNLLPHRAVYDLSLEQASDRSGINGISGRMVYEFAGSACEGYTTTFRFVMRLETDEASRLSDQQTTTYEDGKGEVFQFVNKMYLDNMLDREVKGVARLEGDETLVELSKPERRSETLEATQFPVQHMIEVLEKAAAGGGFYQTTLYDSSEDADRVMMTSVTIGQPKPMAEGDAEKDAAAPLDNQSYWPVSIAYFDPDNERGETLPDYDIGFLLHESGVTRSLDMNYGEFSIRGQLVDLTLFDTVEEEADCAE
ncbi:cell envelope integrity EipB family protein [Nitratireductor aquimarinus]|uniref:cell envelope integrity EipB family protein n=1 Tax=Nitratireductor TaxID=245876 RepID=UPI000DDF7081|nr:MULTISPECIES: cell envelope integrity EipB family protein [Nitratireductor]MBN7776851.1 cell envelope integrity EipB family protein [Nitratireductor pacificus]MBN7780185.1 cell envelope integrity EipB family protein [Nitratireductor pacificus]MBN7788992.1 cell envelope integrity EipB family protein [Nitratireductor aquimarinus]MBY6099060.1 cell envelope integrity EipB family protein [Nitratireductor aquimarinus]MCA1260698.1 cell envelope integrity EipB family protein [Nitratireductor aquima